MNKKIVYFFIFFINSICILCKNPQGVVGSSPKESFDLAMEYYVAGEHKKAFELFSKLLWAFPDNCYVSCMRIKTMKACGYLDQAIASYEKFIALYPDYKMAYKDLGFCYLLKGDFKAGYATHCKIGIDGFRGVNKEKIGSEPYDWHADIAGKTILIIDENGYGDFFQWIRFAKVIKKKGAKVVVKARKELLPLLSHCPYIDVLISQGEKYDDSDFSIYSGEFFRLFQVDEATIPADVPYLYADELLVEKWSRVLSQDKNFKVGICWEPKAYMCRYNKTFLKQGRAAPLLAFYQLSKLKNVSLYSLQKINGLEQICSIPKDFNLYFFKGDFDNKNGRFSDTAAVMKNLDLVITIDTSIAHLAGALGVPVWVLLPKMPDWRWFLDRSDSPWYPTMRLFRKPIFPKKYKHSEFFLKSGMSDWESVMNEIKENLEKVVQNFKRDNT